MAKQFEMEGATIEVEGRTYIIPTRELNAYRIPDELARELRASLKAEDSPHSVTALKGVFGCIPLDKQQYSGPFTEEDFITVSRTH
jgi:hypothetical protein